MTDQVVMGYIGVQCANDEKLGNLFGEFREMQQLLGLPKGPRHCDLAHYVDEAGYHTYIAIAYWDSPAVYAEWAAAPQVEQWWASPERLARGYGYFREVMLPKASHLETIYSAPDKFEGVATMAEGRSGEILEHGYWGGMRDRLAAAQTDSLVGRGRPDVPPGPSKGRRVLVRGHENVALIRSGQDWSETEGEEREHFLKKVAPILEEGMIFLRDKGLSVGCYFNRYVTLVDSAGKPLEKRFAASLWQSLEHMERWAESHPTHVAIFGTFMRMVQNMNADLRLRLYHEVSVIASSEQSYEYVNCHPGTGLLRSQVL